MLLRAPNPHPYFGNNHEAYGFKCPGCEDEHWITVKYGEDTQQARPIWIFDGNLESPTFSPSLHHTITFGDGRPNFICHYFIRNGMIEFLSDCTHKLAGHTVLLP